MKQVRMVVHHRYPFDPRVRREAAIAQEQGYAVEVVCLQGPNEPKHEQVDGVRVYRLPMRHARAAGFGRTVWEYLAFTTLAGAVTFFRTPRDTSHDIVHIHSPPDFLGLAALPAKLLGSKVVLDIHDLSPLLFEERFGGRRGSDHAIALLNAAQRLAAHLADRVVTVTTAYVEELASTGVPREKIRVVMNALDPRLVRQAAESRPSGLGFTVAYHGTITPWYGVGLLVEALARAEQGVPNLRATILGEGDSLEDAMARAERLGIRHRIDFSGRYLPIEEVLPRISVADCGVVPNLTSPLNRLTLSTKLLEYVALGVPAVVARLETLATHFSDDEVTFFEPNDPDALADALTWVATHPEEAQTKADRAHARYLDQYSWESVREGYSAVLDELALGIRPRAC